LDGLDAFRSGEAKRGAAASAREAPAREHIDLARGRAAVELQPRGKPARIEHDVGAVRLGFPFAAHEQAVPPRPEPPLAGASTARQEPPPAHGRDRVSRLEPPQLMKRGLEPLAAVRTQRDALA